jgi:hypothetical protein
MPINHTSAVPDKTGSSAAKRGGGDPTDRAIATLSRAWFEDDLHRRVAEAVDRQLAAFLATQSSLPSRFEQAA